MKKSLQLMIVVMLTPIGLWAQLLGPSPYGNAENPGLGYAGDSSQGNVLIISGRMESDYHDDSIQRRGGDSLFWFGPRFSLRRQSRQLGLVVDYQPDFRLYGKARVLNSLNHGFQFDTNYQVNPRLAVRARGSLLYRRGIFQGNLSEEFMPALGSPATLNQTVFRPLVRQFEDTLRVDAIYQTSRRTSFAVFAGLGQQRNFGEEVSRGENLNNTDVKNGGLLYRHRLSPYTTLGITYLLQDLRTGAETRTVIHTTFFSVAWQLSRGVTLDVFGGPQHTHLHDRLAVASPFVAPWHWALGGAFTKQSGKTVIRFTAERELSDGGGLLGPVTSSVFELSVRRRLGARWQSVCSTSYALNRALVPRLFSSDLRTQTAAFGLERSLTENLTAGLGYEYIHQGSASPNTTLANLNHNRAYFSVFYRFARIGLGR